jgi:raffinose/stachyose/melibiose transport system permease protein
VVNESKRGKFLNRGMLQVVLVVMAFFWLIPIFMMVTVSFMPPDQRAPELGGLLVTRPSLFNYDLVLKGNPIPRYFLNSLAITLPSVVAVVIFASLSAFAFSRLRFWGRDYWYYLLLLTLMLPIPTLVIPIFQLNKALRIYNTYLGLILPYVALGIPFAIVILRGFFDRFPREIEDAARLDGCTSLDVFWRIMLPLSGPALAVVVIWQFMVSWNEFILALVTMESNDLKPLTLVPLVYGGPYMARPGAMFATLVFITVPVVLVYIFMQRYFVSGITGGALRE